MKTAEFGMRIGRMEFAVDVPDDGEPHDVRLVWSGHYDPEWQRPRVSASVDGSPVPSRLKTVHPL